MYKKSKFVDKPWGHEEIWALTETYAAKILTINPGQSLSLQMHEKKVETIRVLEGQLSLTHGSKMENLEIKKMNPGECFHITSGLIHRFESNKEKVVLLEVSTTELDDVVRLEDKYGRVNVK